MLGALLGTTVLLARRPIAGLYSHDAAVLAGAVPLLGWVALFHLSDAAQGVAAFVLRAHRIATLPVLVNALALWGIGLGGGYALAFDALGGTPAFLRGAAGFWCAASLGLLAAALGLTGLMAKVTGNESRARAIA